MGITHTKLPGLTEENAGIYIYMYIKNSLL
jgi:hypothetical protein